MINPLLFPRAALFASKSSRQPPPGWRVNTRKHPPGCLPISPERSAPGKSGIRNNQNKEQKDMSQGTHAGIAAAPQGGCSQKKEGDGRRCCALFKSSRHLPRGGAKIPKTPPPGCLPSSPERPAPGKSGIRNKQNKEQKVMSRGAHVGLAAAPQGRCSQKKKRSVNSSFHVPTPLLPNPRATSPGVARKSRKHLPWGVYLLLRSVLPRESRAFATSKTKSKRS